MRRTQPLGKIANLSFKGRSNESLTLSGAAFLVIFYVIPTSFFGLVSAESISVKGVVDIKIFYFVLSIFFGCFFIGAIFSFLRTALGMYALILTVLLMLNVWRTALDSPLPEVIAVFRSNFLYPIPFLIFASYLRSRTAVRLEGLLRALIYIVFFHSLLYLADFVTNGAVMAGGADAASYRLKVGVDFNVLNIPMLLPLLIIGGLAPLAGLGGGMRIILPIVGLGAGLASTFRGLFLQLALVVVGMLWLSKLKVSVKMIAATVMLVGTSVFFMLGAADQIISKFSELNNSNISEEGTFAFRLDLIDQATTAIVRENSNLFGLGYRRVASPGDYDYVLGSDSYLPPVIYAEGFVGLALRIGLVLVILRMCWRNRRQVGRSGLYCTCGVLLLVSEFFNPIQSPIFTRFDSAPLVAYWFWLIARVDGKIHLR